ncbi:unnamed protein product [Cladocopium goreaui]|uniref:Fe2OG dioxygenase domain-containing protein n=1 Tax=Cladocopium goreaui TaxID=2562237 RepID=A0A9P1DA85_9DINO|nr:unnamed protein product [Cladocopium goreaui]
MHSSRRFFALPAHTKEQYKEPSGYPPRSYGAITSPEGKIYKTQQRDDSGNILNEWLLVKNTSVAIDWNEPYYTSDEGREFYSSVSKHPEQSQWPSEVPELRQVTGAFYQAMEKLADTMHELFALALGISKDVAPETAATCSIDRVTIAHYPPQDTPPAEDQERIQPHWDRTLFSLITTSDYGDEDSEAGRGGLQILVDKDTGDGVDGRAELEVERVERVERVLECFVPVVMSRWSNGRDTAGHCCGMGEWGLKHVVHRVPNPKPGHRDPGRISLMAFVVPDYDTVVECLHCKEDGSVPLYEKTWVGEMMNWGSKLPIYNQTKMEMMRMAQGLYTKKGHQTKLGEPTDVKSIEQMMSTKSIPVLDISALHNGTKDKQSFIARRLSEGFEQTGFAVVTGHGIAPELISNLRNKAYEFFRSPLEEKSKFDKGKGYGFGGYNSVGHENGAQLLGDFSRTLVAELGHFETLLDISGCEMEENAPPVVARQAQSFLHAAERVAKMTSKALQLALNVSDEETSDGDGVPRRSCLVLDPSGGGLRLAYYPSSKAYGENSMGYGSHIDSGGVTVISLDPANPHGLQVDISGVGTTGNDKDRIWVDVPFVPNSLVLNVGALLSRWTGHTWKASIHRVLPNRKIHERVSLITGALSPKVDGPAFAGFKNLATHEAVRAEDSLATRVALHRPEYAGEKGLETEKSIEEETDGRRLAKRHEATMFEICSELVLRFNTRFKLFAFVITPKQ